MSRGDNESRPGERMIIASGPSDLTPMERLAVNFLAYRDGRGRSWPSIDEIAEYLGTTRHAAHDHLKGAKKKGAITWKRWHTTNIYTIFYDKLTVGKTPTVKDESDCREIPPVDCREIPPLTVGKFPTRTGEPDINRIPPQPPRKRGGRVRRGKQGTLDTTAEAVRDLLTEK